MDEAVSGVEEEASAAREVPAAGGLGKAQAEEHTGGEGVAGADDVGGRFPIRVPLDVHPLGEFGSRALRQGVEQAGFDDGEI